MCLQCVTNAVNYGEILPKFYLMRAAKTDYPNHPDQQQWKEGEWALVEMNDPAVYIHTVPVKDPGDECDDRAANDAFFAAAEQLNQDIMSAQHALVVYRLVEAAKAKGYNPATDNFFSGWLLNHIAVFLETAKPIEKPEPNNED